MLVKIIIFLHVNKTNSYSKNEWLWTHNLTKLTKHSNKSNPGRKGWMTKKGTIKKLTVHKIALKYFKILFYAK